MAFRSLYQSPAMSVGVVGRVCVGRWRTLPTATEMREMHAALVPWAKETGPFVALNIVDIRAMVIVPDELRAEMAAVQTSFDGVQLGLATIVRERGFFAAAVRAVVGAVQLLSRARYPQRVFATVGDAAAWANELCAAAGVAGVAAVAVDAAFVALAASSSVSKENAA